MSAPPQPPWDPQDLVDPPVVRGDVYDRTIDRMLQFREDLIAAAPGPVPEFGSREWMEADRVTQTASFALADLRSGLAHGKEMSNRMAGELQQRRDHVAVSHDISGAIDWAQFAANHLTRDELAQRRAAVGPLAGEHPVVPAQESSGPAPAARGDPAAAAVERAAAAAAALTEQDTRDESVRAAEHAGAGEDHRDRLRRGQDPSAAHDDAHVV